MTPCLSTLTKSGGNIDAEVLSELESLLEGPEVVVELTAAMKRVGKKDSDKAIQPFKQGILLRILFSCLIDGDRTNTADFDKPRAATLRQHGEDVAWQNLIERLEERLAFSRTSRDGSVPARDSPSLSGGSGRPQGSLLSRY